MVRARATVRRPELERRSVRGAGRRPKEVPEPLVQRTLVANLAFPEHQRVPTICSKGRRHVAITLYIPREFRPPIPHVVARLLGQGTVRMLVPEAAVDEDDLAVPRKNEIRRAPEDRFGGGENGTLTNERRD
jgi:hypothetical protein